MTKSKVIRSSCRAEYSRAWSLFRRFLLRDRCVSLLYWLLRDALGPIFWRWTGTWIDFHRLPALTVVHGDPEPGAERRHPRVPPMGITNVDVEIKGVRVLVVDDEIDARALLKRILEDSRAIVTVAESADEAIELLQAGKYDVLVSDIGMPGEDGYSLIRRVRSLGAASGGDIPAIALTAYARGEDED